MKKVLMLITSALILWGAWTYFVQLSRPLSLAEELSRLDIPSDSETTVFRQESNEFNGDGYVLTALSLTAEGGKAVEIQCINNGFLNLNTELINENPILLPFYHNNERGG